MNLPHSTFLFDTETTGLPIKGASVTDPKQPYITQMGGMLLDSTWRVRGEINLLIKLPPDVTIHPEAERVTGISKADCDKYGVPLPVAMATFDALKRQAELCVAYNFPFDRTLTEVAAHRCAMPPLWEGAKTFDPMPVLTNILRLPGKFGYKWPKLTEAYEFCFHEKLDTAHDAMADVRGLGRVFNHGLKQGWFFLP